MPVTGDLHVLSETLWAQSKEQETELDPSSSAARAASGRPSSQPGRGGESLRQARQDACGPGAPTVLAVK